MNIPMRNDTSRGGKGKLEDTHLVFNTRHSTGTAVIVATMIVSAEADDLLYL